MPLDSATGQQTRDRPYSPIAYPKSSAQRLAALGNTTVFNYRFHLRTPFSGSDHAANRTMKNTIAREATGAGFTVVIGCWGLLSRLLPPVVSPNMRLLMDFIKALQVTDLIVNDILLV